MCLGAVHLPKRADEQGKPYDADADDAAYSTFVTDQGIICDFNSSWCTRVRKDDLLTVQVNGTKGSAVAGLRECVTQHDANTPKPVWNPDVPASIDYWGGWTPVPWNIPAENAFKAQWELFLRHVVLDEPFRWDLREGAKGVQLAELGLESWQKRAWVDVEDLAIL
jgi:predicted dehydrogenase